VDQKICGKKDRLLITQWKEKQRGARILGKRGVSKIAEIRVMGTMGVEAVLERREKRGGRNRGKGRQWGEESLGGVFLRAKECSGHIGFFMVV